MSSLSHVTADVLWFQLTRCINAALAAAAPELPLFIELHLPGGWSDQTRCCHLPIQLPEHEPIYARFTLTGDGWRQAPFDGRGMWRVGTVVFGSFGEALTVAEAARWGDRDRTQEEEDSRIAEEAGYRLLDALKRRLSRPAT